MRTTVVILSSALAFVLLTAGCDKAAKPSAAPQQASTKPESDEAKKAREYLKAGMYKEAAKILDGEIAKTPADPELHFLRGKCHLGEADPGEARKEFDRAVKIDTKWAATVAETYLGMAREDARGLEAKEVVSNLRVAVKYDASASKAIAQLYCQQAAEKAKQDSFPEAEGLLLLAGTFDAEVAAKQGAEIGSWCVDQAKAAYKEGKTERALKLLALAIKARPASKSEAAALIAQEAVVAVKEGNTSVARNLAQLAKGYDASSTGGFAEACIAKARSLPGTPEESRNIRVWLDMALDPGKGRPSDVGGLYWELILARSLLSDSKEVAELGTSACSLNGDLLEKVTEMFLERVDRVLSQETLDSDAIRNYATAMEKIDSSLMTRFAAVVFESLGRRFEPGKNVAAEWPRIRKIVEYSAGLLPDSATDTKSLGSLLLKLLVQARTIMSVEDAGTFLPKCVAWNRELKKDSVDLMLSRAKLALDADPIEIESAGKLLDRAIALDIDRVDDAAAVVLGQVSNRCADLPRIGKEKFFALAAICDKWDLSPEVKGTSAYRFVRALDSFTKELFQTAIPSLQTVAAKSPNTNEGKAAASILAPPGPGVIEVNQKLTWDEAEILLAHIEITKDALILNFSVKCDKDTQIGQWPLKKPPFMNDNCGGRNLVNKITPEPKHLFSMGMSYNDRWTLPFPAGSGNKFTFAFPMPSEGASRIDCLIPGYMDHEKPWGFTGLRLKPGPFERN